MISFKQFLKKVQEDKLLTKEDEGGMSGGEVSAPSSSSSDLGLQAKPQGAISNGDVLGHCDHTNGDGVFGPNCYHIPCGIPIYGRLPAKRKKKKQYDNLEETNLIDFTEDEVKEIRSHKIVYTTRVSDDYDKFHKGDVVRTPWRTDYKVVDRMDITDITQHPFYDELTTAQRGEITKYANGRIAVLKLKVI